MKQAVLTLSILVIVCQHARGASLVDYKFDGFCQEPGSSWWKWRSSLLDCSNGRKYHCARDYDLPEEFKEGCAEEKFCKAGEEPHLSFIKDDKETKQPDVFCSECFDKEFYNDISNKSSASFSKCPYRKLNICTKQKHKIECTPDNSTSERYCRCDARRGFSPVNDDSNEMCSIKSYDCTDYNQCDEGKQLLLNYTCAKKCAEGFDRLAENSDDCLPLPIITTKTDSTLSTPVNESSTHVPLTKIPKSTRKHPIECETECDKYQICKNGTCVCQDICPAVHDPVCGYHQESDTYKTFSSKCELEKNYCHHRKFYLFSSSECRNGNTGPGYKLIIGLVILAVVIVLLACLVIYFIWKRCKKKQAPEMQPQNHSDERDAGDNQSLLEQELPDGDQENRRSIQRQTSAPLSEPEDTSTPNLSSRKSVVVTYHVAGDYIIMKGRSNQIKRDSNRKYQQGDTVEEEHEQLIKDEPITVAADVHDINSNEHTSLTRDTGHDENINDNSSLDSATGAGTSGKSCTEACQTNKVSGDTFPKSENFRKWQRQMSVSYESVFLKPDLIDVEKILPDRETYRKIINNVMDKCITHLLNVMEPDSMIDKFTEKRILTHIIRRDIKEKENTSGKTRAIIQRIRETGIQNYHVFKICLLETKQHDCLDIIKEIEQNEIKNLQLPGEADSELFYPEKRPTFVPAEKSCTGEVELYRPEKGPTVLAAEKSPEEIAYNCLMDLKSALTVLNEGNRMHTEKDFESVKKMLIEIQGLLPELNSSSLVPNKLPDSLEYLEEYRNTPEGFQAYKSSGKDNSCLYQSVSLLLTGTEDLQLRLRLFATMHAVESYQTYREKLLNLDLETLKVICHLVSANRNKKIEDMDVKEDITDICLQSLVMETACIGTDSSILHVGFLGGALGINIHQHFQQDPGYGSKKETVPWENIVQCESVNSELPDLHVFWVNYNKEENGAMNHIVPLLPVKKVTDEASLQLC